MIKKVFFLDAVNNDTYMKNYGYKTIIYIESLINDNEFEILFIT